MGCAFPIGRNGCVGCVGCVLPLLVLALCVLLPLSLLRGARAAAPPPWKAAAHAPAAAPPNLRQPAPRALASTPRKSAQQIFPFEPKPPALQALPKIWNIPRIGTGIVNSPIVRQ